MFDLFERFVNEPFFLRKDDVKIDHSKEEVE